MKDLTKKDTGMEEGIVLLNDGEQSSQEGNCNSWPYYVVYMALDPELC
jgi:hypothetical protein